MAKQLNVDLRFNADVSAAKAQLQGLQTSINQLTTSMATQGAQLGITPKIQEAQQAAVQLKTALSQSMNVETGKFDLSKFNSSLKSMNTDLGKLKTQLTNLGSAGQQTFMTLAQSIMTAEIPTRRISASLAALGTTLKNTAKWQLSSSMLHGFMGAVQTSYRYAKDLNTSLNNIRIVTGESAEAMDKFAARANKAAKALSASTLDYTDAALIFYQQGLQGKEVEERAEITLKMANVSRQSAEVVSDQLTAVWNNFANGTDSLESFADKMVALGAATASSSDEIAGGLEKFAAIGETIGLSFDYAAAALATITSNTRQSEEVVGTALKTIFARVQGLKLGETLEDGTTLNKYSQALETVGVHIYNANGGLKNMDTILDETAAKWNTLTDDQQTALAQTVAGIRQYNQFIALMDNWESKGVGDKDSMKANLETINESTGALQEQADIYAESWEAASKRVKASAEEVYMDLLDDDFFIDLTNGLADFLGLLDSLLDSMGGARGLLTGLSSILLNMFAGSAAKGLENMVYNFKTFIGLTQKEAMNIQTQTAALVKGVVTSGSGGQPINNQQTAYLTGIESQVGLQHTLLSMKNKLSEQEQLTANAIIEQNAAYAHQIELLGQAADKAKEKTQVARDDVTNVLDDIYLNNVNSAEDWRASIDTDAVTGNMQRIYDTSYKVVNQDLLVAKQQAQNISVNDNAQLGPAIKQYAEALNKAAAEIESIDGETELSSALKKKAEELNRVADKPTGVSEQRKTLKEIQQENSVFDTKAKMQVDSSVKTYGKNHLGIGSSAVTGGDAEAAIKAQERINKSVDGVVKSFKEEKKAAESAGKGIKNLKENTKEAEKTIKNLGNSTRSWSQTMVGVAQGAMSLSFAFNSLNSLKTTWADETIGTGEKLLQTFMSLGMAIPMLINGINGLKTSIMGSNTIQTLAIGLMQTRVALEKEDLETLTAKQIAKKTGLSLDQAEVLLSQMKTAAKLAESGASDTLIASMTAEQVAEALGITTDEAAIVISGAKTGATLGEAAAEAGLTTAKSSGTLATIASTVANWGWLASMSPILAITLVLVAALAGLALIVWGVTAAFKAIVNSTPEAKLKAVKEESQALSEQLNKTKEEANNLKTAFDDYDEVAKKLSECKKGTEEWNQALRENNDKVLELLEKYPQLRDTAGAITIGADGQLIISEEAMANVINLQAQKVAVNTIADNAGKGAVRDQEIENKQREFDKNYSQPVDMTNATADVKIFYTAKEKYGTGNLTDEQLKEVAEELYQDSQYGYLAEDGVDAAKKIVQLYNEINQLKEEDRIQTQLENIETGQVIMAGLEGQEDFNYRGNIAAVVGYNTVNDKNRTYSTEDYNDFIKYNREGENLSREEMVGAYREALSDKANWSFGTRGSGRAQDAMAEYISQQYGEDAAYEIVDFEGDQVRFKVNGGEEQKLSYDVIAEQMMAFQQKGDQAENNKILADYISGLTSQDQADVFSASQTGIFSEQLLEKNKEDIDQIVESLEISDEVIQAMGEDLDGNNEYNQEDVKLWKKKQKEILNSQKAFNNFKKNGIKALDDIHAVLKDVKFDDIADPKQKAAIQAQATEISSMLSETLGADSDLGLDPDFINDNYQIIQDFLNNVENSGAQLQAALQQDALDDVLVNIDVNDTEARQAVTSMHDYIVNNLENQDFQIGVGINTGDFFDKCQSIITAAGMTSKQAQEYFGKMGFDVEGETKTKTTKQTHTIQWPVYGDAEHPLQVTDWETKTWDDTSTQEYFALKTITPNASFGGNIDNINDSGGSTSDSTKKTEDGGNVNPGGSGGGKNTPKDKTFKEKDKKEKKLYEDEFDRYYDITQALERYNRELEETQERKDELWGADKLAAMDAEKKKLGEITAKQKEYLKAISGSEDGTFKGGFLKTDMDALKQLDSDAKFDENGKLINYEELTQKWLKELNSAQEVWNAGMENATNTFNANKKSENADETYDNTKTILDDDLEKAEDAYEKRKAALDKWQETYDLNEEEKQKLEEYLRQRRQLNYEQLEYKLEIRVELNENDIADIEYQLERLGDSNVYASAERIALIEKNAASYRNIADAQIEAIKEAETLYQQYLASDGKEGISAEDYMARLQESKEALQEAEMSIRDGIAQIGDELENTFDLVDEKLDQQFTKFDQLIELMDHYKNIVSLTEGEVSYKEFNKILKASQEVLRDRIAADESEVAMWTARREQLEADIATLPEDSPAKREAEEALQAIMEKEADAKSQLMADIEQLGEYAREIFENSIEQAMKDFEDEMFGRPLNSIIESIEMMNSRQEELLTTTNKIYETNKLIRSIEKDIEATTNNRAKQAFAEFQNKVKQKQEQNELTKFELDLLTAEYEMTKAQIALEEAQNAKDTVRLTRDAEGNYGYVYTANEDKVADAEQALDDATNNYYNTALEGAQKYQDQIYQHIQEWEEKVKEVYLDQTLSEEEKNKKIKEINDTYNTLITQDKNLYYMAVGAMQEESYNNQVDYDLKGIKSAENWFTECDSFLSDLEDAQDEYDRNTKEVSDHTEENFGRMETSIRNTKIESEKLKNQIVNDLVPELDTTLKDSIDKATGAWWKYIEALQEVIRLTDEAMKKNHDTQLKEIYKEDYAAEISKRLANGADYDDYDIQQLLQARWDKMGGVDNTDYQALIDAGGTPEQIALWEILRRFKIDKTDWATIDGDWAKDIRATKMDQDFAQLIINYFKSSPYARWSDETVQGYLAARQAKINENHEDAKGAISNEELKTYVAQLLNKKPEQLKTGGYTGSWGPEGKLAVLHEKELVLNAEDTKNFLSAAGILREISQMLDRDALIASLGAINLRAMTLNSPADQILQQEVTIHADFPNVTDHNEIELAIDNLINAASQHAYRT